ncbi:MAG TPA: class I SAM-dependent methyltransferase [Candidatus Elarobacter sp.]|jgi:hypothetical protein
MNGEPQRRIEDVRSESSEDREHVARLSRALGALEARLRAIEGKSQDRRDQTLYTAQSAGRLAALGESLDVAARRIAVLQPAHAGDTSCAAATGVSAAGNGAPESGDWAGADDAAFLAGVVTTIPGFLDDYAARRTMELLAYQEAAGIRGSLLEVGVFYGRYLSILLRSALRTGDPIAALDTFEIVGAPLVELMMRPLAAGRVTYVQQASRTISAGEIAQVLGTASRFISIDGSHAAEDALWDLGLAQELIAPEGVIAVDDFLNPVTPGVNEAVHRFFAEPRRVVPFAYTANKLFLCPAGRAATYRGVFENAVIADTGDPRSETFRASLPHLRQLVEQTLWGQPLLIVP